MELKLPPPLVFLCCAALIYFLPNYTQTAFFAWAALPFALLGGLIDLAALTLFLQKKTSINPLDPHKTSQLVTHGIYRFTRNPMYVGLLCWLIAWALWLGNAFAFLVIWGFMHYITHFQILPEERILAAKFGEDYQRYQQKTPRWLW